MEATSISTARSLEFSFVKVVRLSRVRLSYDSACTWRDVLCADADFRYSEGMTNDAMLAAIDEEISKLQNVRAMLADPAAPAVKKTLGRPKKIVSAAPVKSAKKRVLSDDAKARIAAAQKKRWAAAKKAAK